MVLNYTQVIASLVALLFQIPGLDFSQPIDHFEAFSGKMSVTKGEWSETCPVICTSFDGLLKRGIIYTYMYVHISYII